MRFASALVLAALSLAPSAPRSGCAYPAVAVVELFTSEGCASCPPADQLLIEIAEEARRSGKAVYPLALHVDYWDQLGWKDPYGSAAYTRRQRDYARVLGARETYTPQMVVNGHTAFVGSRRRSAEHAIEQALAQATSCDVRIAHAQAGKDGAARVGVQLTGAEPGDRVVAALVERSVERRVGAGENKGKTLRHGEVVRALETAPAVSNQEVAFSLRARGALSGPASVVVFVQDGRTLQVVGASRADL